MKEKNLIKKANTLVESKYKLTLLEQKFISLMISMIKPTDENFKEYPIDSKRIAEDLGLEKNDRARYDIQKAIDLLQTRLLWIKKTDHLGYSRSGWITQANYDEEKKIRSVRINEDLKPYLIDLKNQYTKYRLKNIIKLRSVYSIRLYELLKQYESTGKRIIKIDDLKAMLNIEKRYKLYGDFKRKVLLVAQDELKEKTDIYFMFKEIKTVRKITSIEFRIYQNPKSKDAKPKKQQEAIFPATDQKRLFDLEKLESDPDIVKRLRNELGLRRRDALTIYSKGNDYITDKDIRNEVKALGIAWDKYLLEKLELTLNAIKENKSHTPKGFFREAIKNNWTSQKSDNDKKQADKNRLTKEIGELQEKIYLTDDYDERQLLIKKLLSIQKKYVSIRK